MGNNIPNDIIYYGIRFTKDMTVDEKEVSIRNSIFTKYDTDHNRSFDDSEWESFVKDTEQIETRRAKNYKNQNSSVLRKYWHKLNKIGKKFEKIERQRKKFTKSNYFNKMIEFEQKYENLRLVVLADNEKAPEGVQIYDISSFGIGYQEETGQCYQKAYIIGLEELNEDEQKEYFKLLDNTINDANAWRNLEDEAVKLLEEENKYGLLFDLADNGIIDKVQTEYQNDQIYEDFKIKIRSNINPFWGNIQSLEAERNEVYNEFIKTPDNTQESQAKRNSLDRRLIELDTQILQFYNASEKWYINSYEQLKNGTYVYANANVIVSPEDFKDKTHPTYGLNVSAGGASENYSFNITELAEISDGYRNIAGSFSIGSKCGLNAGFGFSNTKNEISTNDNFENIGFPLPKENRLYNYSFGYKNEKWDAQVYHMRSDTDGNKYENTTINTERHFGNMDISAAGNFNEMTANLSTGLVNNFKFQNNQNLSFNLQPKIIASYDIKTESAAINPGIYGALSFNSNKGINGILSFSDTFTYTNQTGNNSYSYSNILSANGNLNYKNIGANINFSHTLYSTYGDYSNTNKNWAVGFGGSYTTDRTSFNINIAHTEGLEDSGTMLTFGVTQKLYSKKPKETNLGE